MITIDASTATFDYSKVGSPPSNTLGYYPAKLLVVDSSVSFFVNTPAGPTMGDFPIKPGTSPSRPYTLAEYLALPGAHLVKDVPVSYVKRINPYDPTLHPERTFKLQKRHGFGISQVNNVVYIIGGWVGNVPQQTVEAIDLTRTQFPIHSSSDAGSTILPMPTDRGDAGCTVLNNQIYVIGGRNNTAISPQDPGGILDKVEQFNPATGAWTVRPAIGYPSSRYPLVGPGAATSHITISGTVYTVMWVMGGVTTDGSVSPRTYLYYPNANPANDQWDYTDFPAMRTPRYSFSTAVMSFADANGIHDIVYTFGGQVAGGAVVSTTEAFIPDYNVWVTLPNMKTPRAGHTSFGAGSAIYTYGGFTTNPTGGNYTAASTAEVYDGNLDWSGTLPISVTPPDQGRYYLGGVLVPASVEGEIALVIGGVSNSGEYNSVDEFIYTGAP